MQAGGVEGARTANIPGPGLCDAWRRCCVLALFRRKTALRRDNQSCICHGMPGFLQRYMALDDQNKPVRSEDLEELVGELRMMARRLLSAESEAHSFTPT